MKTILAPVDFSDATPGVAGQATKLAKAIGARVLVAYVMSPLLPVQELSYVAEDLFRRERMARENDLSRIVADITSRGIEADKLLLEGAAISCIIAEAKRRDADYIVMGSHGRGAFHDLLVGGTTEGVVRRAGCPVIVVPFHVRSNAKSRKFNES